MTSQLAILEHEDHYSVEADSMIVNRFLVDYALTMECLGDDGQFIGFRIEEDFTFRNAGESFPVSADRATTQFCPLFAMLHKSVTSICMWKSGSLEIHFEDDSEIKVEPNDQYEAWEAYASSGLKVISLPGGGLSVWS